MPKARKKLSKQLENDNVVYLEASDFSAPVMETLRALISTLEEKDTYTHGHSIRVAEYAVAIAEQIGLSLAELQEVELCALFHDVGKIGIPDEILMKPGKLSKAEFEIMKSHPSRSAKILEKISIFKNIIPGILHHHERYDGFGYPVGLKGTEIPLYSRIVLIADTYDAMTSTRPYRLALHSELAIEELRRCTNTQFDESLVRAFVEALANQATGKQRKTFVKKIA